MPPEAMHAHGNANEQTNVVIVVSVLRENFKRIKGVVPLKTNNFCMKQTIVGISLR